jgi:SAM-dependent MidA family methyltransferase
VSALDTIRQLIRQRGPLTVAEFMSVALYHPEHGYYSKAARRTGRNGDFFTSVDVGPIFGSLLGRQFAEMWRIMGDPESRVRGPRPLPDSEADHGSRTADPRFRPPDREAFDLVEAAASNGQLACDVLDWARDHDPEFYHAIRLHLVETSPRARAAHQETLASHAGKLAASSGRLPDDVHGVIYANELLDALPVHSVVMTEHGLRELYVDLAPDGRLIERAGRPSTDALERYLAANSVQLEPGWRAEINLAALAWMARACRALHRGFLLLIDYGHEARELYSATHAAGTLTTFHRHIADGGPRGANAPPSWLADPGSHDMTSHVDLTAIRHAAEELGCVTAGMLDQTYFLLALGLSDLIEETSGSVEALRRRLALKTLLMPGGLGSTHKVMIFASGVEAAGLLGLSGTRRLT